MRKPLIVDAFAGGGGASVGIEMALGTEVFIAINHDEMAIKMHKVNHPNTIHLTEDIFTVDLTKYIGDRHVDLMWSSPDCTQFSKAKGGKPRIKGIRMLPWAVYKHTKAILPDVVMMENVEEIQDWGPLDDAGHPIPERKGEDYNEFVNAMMGLGYEFECRELVAADYGAPTTRKRWYAIFRRDGRQIVWPEPTHSKNPAETGLKPWVDCGRYIDWSDLGKSIFGRKKPLAEKTQRRIANGIKKFILDNPNPYIVNDGRATAFLIQYHSETKSDAVRGQNLSDPIQTIDTSNRYGLVTVFMEKHENDRSNTSDQKTNRHGRNSTYAGRDVLESRQNDKYTRDYSDAEEENGSKTEQRLSRRGCVDERKTVSLDSAQGGVDVACGGNPKKYGYKPQGREQTQQQSRKSGSRHEGRESSSCLRHGPKNKNGLCEGLLGQSESSKRNGDVVFTDWENLGNLQYNSLQSRKICISSWLIKYYGADKDGQPLSEPLGTIVTKDRFGLVTVIIDGDRYAITDIFLRMLKPEELKLMQGFPEDYIIDRDSEWKPYPKTEQVARIGNSVVPIMAKVLVEANCGYLKVGEREKNHRFQSEENGQMRMIV